MSAVFHALTIGRREYRLHPPHANESRWFLSCDGTSLAVTRLVHMVLNETIKEQRRGEWRRPRKHGLIWRLQRMPYKQRVVLRAWIATIAGGG